MAFKRCTLWLQALSWFGSVRATCRQTRLWIDSRQFAPAFLFFWPEQWVTSTSLPSLLLSAPDFGFEAVGAWPDETSYSAAITACETNLMWRRCIATMPVCLALSCCVISIGSCRLSVALLSELSQSLAPNAICWSAEISLAAQLACSEM